MSVDSGEPVVEELIGAIQRNKHQRFDAQCREDGRGAHVPVVGVDIQAQACPT